MANSGVAHARKRAEAADVLYKEVMGAYPPPTPEKANKARLDLTAAQKTFHAAFDADYAVNWA